VVSALTVAISACEKIILPRDGGPSFSVNRDVGLVSHRSMVDLSSMTRFFINFFGLDESRTWILLPGSGDNDFSLRQDGGDSLAHVARLFLSLHLT
jgi:hypothetical protein